MTLRSSARCRRVGVLGDPGRAVPRISDQVVEGLSLADIDAELEKLIEWGRSG